MNGSKEYPLHWHANRCENSMGEHGKDQIFIGHVAAITTRRAADSEGPRGRECSTTQGVYIYTHPKP